MLCHLKSRPKVFFIEQDQIHSRLRERDYNNLVGVFNSSVQYPLWVKGLLYAHGKTQLMKTFGLISL